MQNIAWLKNVIIKISYMLNMHLRGRPLMILGWAEKIGKKIGGSPQGKNVESHSPTKIFPVSIFGGKKFILKSSSGPHPPEYLHFTC